MEFSLAGHRHSSKVPTQKCRPHTVFSMMKPPWVLSTLGAYEWDEAGLTQSGGQGSQPWRSESWAQIYRRKLQGTKEMFGLWEGQYTQRTRSERVRHAQSGEGPCGGNGMDGTVCDENDRAGDTGDIQGANLYHKNMESHLSG